MSLSDLKAQKAILDEQIASIEFQELTNELKVKYKEILPDPTTHIALAYVDDELSIGMVTVIYKSGQIFGNGFFMSENGKVKKLFEQPLEYNEKDGIGELIRDNIKIVKTIPFTQSLWDNINDIVVKK